MKSLAELQAIRDKARASVNIRENAEAETRVMVGMATCGIAAGARPVLNAFVEEVAEVITPGQEKVTYVKMTAEKAVRVVNDHLVNGNVVTEYTIGANAIGAK